MQIGNEQSTIQLVVSISLFEKDITVILQCTSLTPTSHNPDGTMFQEKFEGIEIKEAETAYPNEVDIWNFHIWMICLLLLGDPVVNRIFS